MRVVEASLRPAHTWGTRLSGPGVACQRRASLQEP